MKSVEVFSCVMFHVCVMKSCMVVLLDDQERVKYLRIMCSTVSA